MIRKKLTKATALVLTTILFISTFGVNMFVQAEEMESYAESTAITYSNERIDNNYSIVSAGYTLPEYSGSQIDYQIDEIYQDGTAKLVTDIRGYTKNSSVVEAQMGDEVNLVIDVPQSAVYYLSFDYLSFDDSILPVELSMKVNDEFLFYELRRQSFESLWVAKAEKSYDRYGNEIIGIPDKVYEWQSKYVKDASYRHTEALGLELSSGENKITLNISEGSILLGNIHLSARINIADYSGPVKAEGSSIIPIQAEDFTYRNSSSIRGVCEFNPNLFPYEVKTKALNTIDQESFKDAGQKVTYEFTAPSSGYYYIAMNYVQSDKSDFPVFIDIDIDGIIPNIEFKDYQFAYIKDYKLLTLTDDSGENLSVYITEGNHTISLMISMEPIHTALETVEKIMNDVNDLSLEITKVVGTNMDKYRDFDLEKYIPGIGDQLIAWAEELDQVMEDALVYNKKASKIAAFTSLTVASNQLRSLAEKPDELLYRINELAISRNSVNMHLANLTDSLNKNKISIDSIYLYQEDATKELPKKVGFFKKLWLSIVRFVSSFTEQAYSASNTDPENLQIWVNRSRLHLEVMQKLIDEDFTAKTGIKVDLSLMPDQNKLVLANASGDSPDIATGINYSIPVELGIRGALKDLTEFDGFAEVAGRYSEGLLVPSTIGNGIYALPETMNFWVLYYRSDVLSKLGLEVPNTIDDLKNILTDLQMRGLNFFYPTAGMVALKTLHGTTPLLFQYGAEVYTDYAGKTGINSEAAIEGFTELTQLFTIYNIPKDIPNFYQHFRIGDLPLGIAEFSTYNLLTNAAPEIASSWSIALVPGVPTGTYDENGDEIINRYTSAGAESTVMFESNPEREAKAWEFMKWWSSTEVQAAYGQTLQISYGNEYYWNTANTEAFENLPWKYEHKKVILEQNSWALEAPRILGTYMLEREMSDAYNAIVVDGKSLRITIDNAVKRINRETERKLEEFGFLENGVMIKEYEVPTIESVRKILERSAKE